MTSVAEFLDVADDRGDALLADLKEMVALGAAEMPRNQQIELGPSEVGYDCARRLTLGMLEAPHCNPDYDPLPALFGTGMHGLLEGFAHAANKRLGRIRWIPEQRVQARPGGLSGTCDLFDLDTLTVIDHKCPGTTRFKKYTKRGPSPVYRRQVQIYAYGYWRKIGIRPRRVAIFWLPRAGTLHEAKLFCEPFDPAVAEGVFERMDNIALVANDLDLEHHPELIPIIPAAPDDDCMFCPFFNPVADGSNGYECRGHVQ